MNHASFDDETLVKLCIQHQSDDVFTRELVERYGRLIMQTITWTFKRFSSAIREDIEDVFQEVFASLFKDQCSALARFDPKRASLGTYLCTIARNATINACKKKRVDIKEYIDSIGGGYLNPETLLENMDLMEQIESIRSLFSVKERLFFKFYFEDCMPPEEIADVLGVTIDTVYSKKAKIVEKLKHLLPKHGEKG
jgi:RNA polymerase sigma-70 factor (ECF subfamily)